MGIFNRLFGKTSKLEQNTASNAYSKYSPGYPENKTYTKEEAQLVAPQFLKHLMESGKLIDTTTNPETFFYRYGFALHRLTELAKMETLIDFGDRMSLPSQAKLTMENSKQENIRKLIDRIKNKAEEKLYSLKTQKGVIGCIDTLASEIGAYDSEMDETTLAYKQAVIAELKTRFVNSHFSSNAEKNETVMNDDGTPWGWIGHHQDFQKQCSEIEMELWRAPSSMANNLDKLNALRACLPECERYEEEFLKHGIYFQRYFHSMVTESILQSIEKCETIQAEYDEINETILNAIGNDGGVLQSELLKQIPTKFTSYARSYIGELETSGRIRKEKEGRTFRLFLDS